MGEARVTRRGLFAALRTRQAERVGTRQTEQVARPRPAAPEAPPPPARTGTPPEPEGTAERNAPPARIQPAACLAFRGTICSVCVERCPEPGAIEVDYGRPRVVAQVCTGCRECAERCPAPTTAITFPE